MCNREWERELKLPFRLTKPIFEIKFSPQKKAEVAELADALRSGRSEGSLMWVQVPPSAPQSTVLIKFRCFEESGTRDSLKGEFFVTPPILWAKHARRVP